MSRITAVKLTLLGVLCCGFLLLQNPVHAASLCPSNLTKQQCYDYLVKLKNDLTNQRKKIESNLKQVQAQQGDLQSQIDQINAQISENENELSQKQVDIELTSLDIAGMGDQISQTKTHVDTLKQEAQTAISKINEIAMISYRINNTPIWYIFMQNDLISALEMLRYFDYIVQQEQVRLAQYKNLQAQLNAEEQVLADAQNQVITKRTDLENDNLAILQLTATLSSQRGKQQSLVAALAQQAKQLAAQRAQLIKQQNQADSEEMAIAMSLFKSGRLGAGTPVHKGDIIGFEGHTGCAYGSHLHFGFIKSTNKAQYTSNVNPFAAGYLNTNGSYVTDGKGVAPLRGALITQWFHDGDYIDLISTTDGDQAGDRYFIKVGALKCDPTYSGWHYLRGEGAPVRAVLDGTVYRGTIDRFGGNFVIIDHGNNLRSAYYHLR